MDQACYIVFDLEWNQSAEGKQGEVQDLPFEILEIGAVKLNRDREPVGEFSRIIRPVVYTKLHYKVLEITHVGMDELKKRGVPFAEAVREFLSWCEAPEEEGQPGARPVFCTWGNMDLTELQRNMAFHGVKNPFPYPLLYYDIQKLYNLLYLDNSKNKLPLEKAVEELGLPPAEQFHRALDDARCTAAVLKKMDFRRVEEYLSLDYYRLPRDSGEEIYLVFPDYSKFVSRKFSSREDAIADKTVTDLLCYRCRRMLRKKIRWFTGNQRYYYAVGICPEHGYVKGKIRMKHTSDGMVYAVKTIKITDEAGAEMIRRKKEASVDKRRMKHHLKL
ncbi:MAG: exonuclease domain-containing protein [Stomatobaculum sp.]|nr:exonuclease domain-containing protein [Stomatobaculum sp.]